MTEIWLAKSKITKWVRTAILQRLEQKDKFFIVQAWYKLSIQRMRLENINKNLKNRPNLKFCSQNSAIKGFEITDTHKW